jgi:general transcription factor 3C polypeptide 3 (transcription factor C subunit 4)
VVDVSFINPSSLGYTKQALYCYQKLCSVDPTNLSAFWERAALAKEAGELRVVCSFFSSLFPFLFFILAHLWLTFEQARNALLSILKQVPHDLTVLDDLRPLLVTLDELPLCAEIFQSAFDHYQSVYPAGRGTNPSIQLNNATQDNQEVDANREIPGGGFGMLELLALADTYNALGNAKAAVNVIRRGERWLQGRAAQRFWDVCEDDREYDLPITATDGIFSACGAGIGSGSTEVSADQRKGDVQPGFYPLDLNARHRLAIARIKLGDIEEGKASSWPNPWGKKFIGSLPSQMHASIILAEDVLDFSSLFVEIADVYFEHSRYDDALMVYEKLSEHAEVSILFYVLSPL